MAETGFRGDRSNAVRVTGLEDLQVRLSQMPGVIGRRYLTTAMQRAVKPLEAELLATTPVGPTGNLRRAVDSRVRSYASGVAFGIVGYKRAVSKDTADNKGFHSHLVEFGTNERRPTKSPVLSAAGIGGWRPPGWVGRWPMVARYVRGARALHPLHHAFQAVGGRCAAILASEMAAAFERAATDRGGAG